MKMRKAGAKSFSGNVRNPLRAADAREPSDGIGADERSDAVRDEVLSDYAPLPRAERLCRGDVLVLLENHNLRADDSRHADPIKEREHDEHRDHVRAEKLNPAETGQRAQRAEREFQRLREQDDYEDIGNRIDDVDDSHHHQIDDAAEIAGNRAVERAYHEDEYRRDDADHERDPPADHDADSVVAPVLVRAEKMREDGLARLNRGNLGLRILHRAEALASLDLLLILVGIEHRHEKAEHDDEKHDRKRGHRNLVLAEPSYPVLPEADGLAHDDERFLLLRRSRNEIADFQLEAQNVLFVFHNF